MGDVRLRELERRWRETGAEEDEAALLAERTRRGLLDADLLRLAAYLGHPAARRAAPADAPRAPSPGELEELVRGLATCPRMALVRAGVVVIQAVSPALDEEATHPAGQVVQALCAWLRDPTPRRAAESRRWAQRVVRRGAPTASALRACHAISLCGHLTVHRNPGLGLARAVTQASAPDAGPPPPAAPPVDRATLDAALRRELGAWALGRSELDTPEAAP